eukprot:TRINITY_DN41484_c0_g1_i1.p1 TRINITY_DN41484_c0_g1~~TRINITY_DN41484_c0_g1_i1.p1  ORF type:complete len:133 (+),score=31.45 TRINITY_DN41484_c0_g1_i1:57-455(+)
MVFEFCGFIFFFKQKTAYEMQRGLVGSEMCIRDSLYYIYSLRFVSFNQPPFSSTLLSIIILDYYTYLSRTHLLSTFLSPLFFSHFLSPMYSALTVSYTHLTLPRILLVQISVVAVSLKKKKRKQQQIYVKIQ